MDIFYGMGSFDPSAYLAVFVVACIPFCIKNWNLRGVLYAALITALAYVSPCLFSLGVLMLCAGLVYRSQVDNENLARRSSGTVQYSYDFFSEHGYDGFVLVSPGGSSFEHIQSNDGRISDAMYKAAQRAKAISPYLPNGDIIVCTEVTEKGGRVVITDKIVTADQIRFYQEYGTWKNSSNYKPIAKDIVYTGNGKWDAQFETDDQGRVNLPNPEGLVKHFMDNFNGPELKNKIRR